MLQDILDFFCKNWIYINLMVNIIQPKTDLNTKNIINPTFNKKIAEITQPAC